jgi:hypothetical protein
MVPEPVLDFKGGECLAVPGAEVVNPVHLLGDEKVLERVARADDDLIVGVRHELVAKRDAQRCG